MFASFFAPDRRETRDFVLRSYLPGDGVRLEGAVPPSYEHLRTFLKWAVAEYEEGEAEKTARRFRARYITGREYVVAIVSTDGETLLGGCGFHPRDVNLDAHCAEIGMWIRADRAGSGLGTAVLVEMLRWGFDEWPWRRLMWRCAVENRASARVAEKAGMTFECKRRGDRFNAAGERSDTLVYVALKGEWSPPE